MNEKTEKLNSILKEYRTGDFHKRLSLFLNYRDLRFEFVEIDESELNSVLTCRVQYIV